MNIQLSPDDSHALSALREDIAERLAELRRCQATFEAAEAKFASIREARLNERNPAKQVQMEAELEIACRESNAARQTAEGAKKDLQRAFRRIRMTPTYRRFRPADARRIHTQSLGWLDQQLETARGRKVVVVTHHAPSPQSIRQRFRNDPLNPAFASNLESFVAASNASLWIHGHIHQHSDYVIGSTRVIANPRGYPCEPQIGFNPALVVEI